MGAPRKPKLLVVDDDVDIQRSTKRAAEAEGYEVLQDFDGQLVLPTARTESPDLILLDVNLPVVDGRDLLRHLKSDPETARIPVLMYSARISQPDRHVALGLGAEDFLDKPCSSTTLMNKIRNMIRSAKEEKAPSALTILVVEDEPPLRTALVRFLRKAGYTVLDAENAEDALQLIAGRSEPIQVLLTDMSLPLMQGPALAAQVRARHAGLLVLFMSGSDDRAHLALGEELIEKPFQLDELLEHLARLAKLGRP